MKAKKTVPTKNSNFLSESQPVYSLSKCDDGELKVEPKEIRFESVEPEKLYIMTFSARNNTKVAQRIRIKPPHSGYFALNYIPSGAVAPGLDIRAEIECQLPLDIPDIIFTDKVVVSMGNHNVEIPIFACKPYANIKFNRVLDCKNIVLHQHMTAEIDFQNIGSVVGKVKLIYNPDSFIKSMVPSNFELEPQGALKSNQVVKVHVDSRELGHFRELVKVSIAGTIDDALIDISAHFIEPKLTLLTGDNEGLLETANFGSAFYGQTVSIKGLLVNSGPLPLSFNAVYEGEENNDGEATDAPQTDDAVTTHHIKSLTMFPSDGQVKPFSQLPVELWFKPTLLIPEKGFHKQNFDDNRTSRPLTRKVTIECSEADQKICVTMQGSVTAPAVTVNPSLLRFGECPVNDRRDILLTLTNKTKHTTAYEFPIIANFKFAPTKGILQGSESISVVATFLPPQLGKFKSLIKLLLAGGLGFVEIRAIGDSNHPGERKQLTGGTDKLPEDFKKQLKFVNPEEEATARHEKKKYDELVAHEKHVALHSTALGKITTMQLQMGAAGYIAAAEAVVEGNESGAAVSTISRFDPMDSFSAASSKERDYLYGYTEMGYSAAQQKAIDDYNEAMLEQHKEHNKSYNFYLQQSHALRKESQEKRTHQQRIQRGAVDFKDPFGVNMGIERGLEEPVLKIPAAGEPLWLANAAKGGLLDDLDSKGGGNNRMAIDENRLIAKKFSSTPATQAELRDCTVELSQDELKLVSPSHKVKKKRV